MIFIFAYSVDYVLDKHRLDCADAQADLCFRILHMTVIYFVKPACSRLCYTCRSSNFRASVKAVIVLSGEHCIEIIFSIKYPLQGFLWLRICCSNGNS